MGLGIPPHTALEACRDLGSAGIGGKDLGSARWY